MRRTSPPQYDVWTAPHRSQVHFPCRSFTVGRVDSLVAGRSRDTQRHFLQARRTAEP